MLAALDDLLRRGSVASVRAGSHSHDPLVDRAGDAVLLLDEDFGDGDGCGVKAIWGLLSTALLSLMSLLVEASKRSLTTYLLMALS